MAEYRRMKLSDAIREGAKAHLQCFDTFVVRSEIGDHRTCAIGAAYYAITGELPFPRYDETGFQATYRVWDTIERYTDAPGHLAMTASRWNDLDRFSREEIATMVAREGH